MWTYPKSKDEGYKSDFFVKGTLTWVRLSATSPQNEICAEKSAPTVTDSATD